MTLRFLPTLRGPFGRLWFGNHNTVEDLKRATPHMSSRLQTSRYILVTTAGGAVLLWRRLNGSMCAVLLWVYRVRASPSLGNREICQCHTHITNRLGRLSTPCFSNGRKDAVLLARQVPAIDMAIIDNTRRIERGLKCILSELPLILSRSEVSGLNK